MLIGRGDDYGLGTYSDLGRVESWRGSPLGSALSVSRVSPYVPVGGELLFKLLQGADKSLDSESANGICST